MDTPLQHSSFRHNPSSHFFLPVCVRARQRVGCDQQRTAFNEVDGGKINVVPLKMISSHPIIASRFHQFTVWERICRNAGRGRKCELWRRCANISLSSYLPLYLFPPPQLRTSSCEHWANVFAGRKPVNYKALTNVISSLRTSPLFFPTNSLAACPTFN